jgi:hypothetical protein
VFGQPFHNFRILAGPTFELEHSDDFFFFAALYHCALLSKVSRGRRAARFDEPFRGRRCEPQRFARLSRRD